MTLLPPNPSSSTKKPVAGRHKPAWAETGPDELHLRYYVLVLVSLMALILLMRISGGNLSTTEITLLTLVIALFGANGARK